MGIAVLADLHLEGLVNILPGDTVALQFEAMRRALTRATSLGVTDVVVAGDLFDNAKPHDRTKLRLADLIAEFDQRWYVLPGNHDRPLVDDHSLHTLDWLGSRRHLDVRVVFDPTVVRISGIPVFLCPHPYVEDQPPSARFSVGHYARTGARRDNGSVEGNGANPKGLWVLGDFHDPQSGKGWRYTGSLTAVEWIESGQRKGFDWIRLVNGRLKVSHVPVEQPYTLNLLEVGDQSDLKQINSRDGTAYWMLRLHPGVTLPSNWQSDYPTVRRVVPVGHVRDLRERVHSLQLSDDALEGLDSWLLARGNLDSKQVAWAVEYARRSR